MSASLKAELIRKRFYGAVDFDELNAEKARIIRGSMRRGKQKAMKLPDNEPLRTELLALFTATIAAMSALIQNIPEGQATVALELGGQQFQRYIEAYAEERGAQVNGS